jgi:hypothetical protein
MSDVLKQIYNACDPYKPATDEYYQDCSEARGSNALTHEFQRRLALANDYLCFLFTGHIGCGKSSELEQLRHALERPTPTGARYFPILLNVDDYIEERDVDTTDLLLAVVTELADTLREKVGVKLEDSYFVKRLNEITEFFLSDVEIKEGELPLWGAKVKIQRLKRDPDARKKVREKLEPKMPTMLAEVNTVFEEARRALRNLDVERGEPPYHDFILILDNLEKVHRFTGKAEGLESQRELFLERASQLTAMKAHVVYTVPLPLARHDGPQLGQCYDGEPFVLPMIKVTERGTRRRCQPGIDCLRTLLQKRLGDLALNEVFQPDALDFLLTCSGGHVRSLMLFVQHACVYATNVPIPLAAAHRAIRQTVRAYSTAIHEHHWEKLARLDLSPDQMVLGGDDDYLNMLENLSVLEYINGGEGEDPFAPAEPWYAVNPIVRELRKFKAAVSGLSKVSAS